MRTNQFETMKVRLDMPLSLITLIVSLYPIMRLATGSRLYVALSLLIVALLVAIQRKTTAVEKRLSDECGDVVSEELHRARVVCLLATGTSAIAFGIFSAYIVLIVFRFI
jgi:hypothetical protein